MTNNLGRTLCEAFKGRHLEVMRPLLEHGAAPDVPHNFLRLLTHSASISGQLEADVVRLLLQHHADVNATARPATTTRRYIQAET
jgi:ankyrin repeat protein